MKSRYLSKLTIACFIMPIILLFGVTAAAEEKQNDTPATCPVEIQKFDPSGVSVRIRNVSGKKIVGMVFNAALADPTEHWKWLHWDYDPRRPLRDFGWNKPINVAGTKKLSWDRADLDFEHGGGGAFVLASVLFADGTSWEEPATRSSCRYIWHNDHKKTFFKPISLPPRK